MKILCNIPRSCFSPQPRVDAAFALFRKRKIPILDGDAARQFQDLLSYLHPRGPQLAATLRLVFTRVQVKQISANLGLDRRRRLGDVTFAEWQAIAKAFAEHASPAALARIKGAHARLAKEQAGLSKRHRTSRG